jgi:hypothetical protein
VAVDFLVDLGITVRRENAGQLGRELAKEYCLVEHVTHEHEFKDERLFFHVKERERCS